MHTPQKQEFFLEIIKPSHYDDDGYVIQWVRSFIPSNSLACLIGLAHDVQQRRALGDDVEIVVQAYDECHTVIRPQNIIRRIRQGGGRGFVLMAGVQSNQFPRAADLAREFRAAGIPVAIGGFHVSGCLSMLPELPPEIKAVQELGVTLFAGEAEGRLEGLLRDAMQGTLQPVYNYLLDLPDLEGQVMPYLPPEIARRSFNFTAFDVGRGCPFRCSFCTIINVQGRKSRHRDADDVERLIRSYVAQGVRRFFITDDNMARNKNWESIFDRLIDLREKEGIRLKIFIQVDTMCHKIPNFIEKATRAGCKRVFIGMESVSPENLAAAKKFQNRISEYRTMLHKWRDHGALTHAGYILGFPADTPESIERDIKVLQQELPIDIVEFFILTPLPGSEDHKILAEKGVSMDPDMNNYDTEHVAVRHERMTDDQWRAAYDRAWHLYYSPEHVETMMRRAEVSGLGARKIKGAVMLYYGSYRSEGLHPLQCGVLRRKVRTTRRATFPRENPLLFYPRRLWEIVSTAVTTGLYYFQIDRTRRRVERDPRSQSYTDPALTPVVEAEEVRSPKCAGEVHDPAVVPLVLQFPIAPAPVQPNLKRVA
ncbi:MAG: radical SAM protein [Planctomycetaceae bacterium]|nr:radical SAM protein [Planctomycetaceae bacterium]